MSRFDTFAALREFWAGLAARTTFSWVGAAAFCAVEVVLCAALVRPQALAHLSPRHLMLNRGDEYAILATQLAALRLQPTKRLQVVYMGSSCASRALTTRDVDELGAEVSAAAQTKVLFRNFSTISQRMEESLVITDQLPASFHGVVVLMVSDYLDDYSRPKVLEAHRRLAVQSAPSVLPIWRADGYEPRHTGNFFIDHLDFFAARRAVAVRLGRLRGRPGQGAFDPEKLDKDIQRFEHEHERAAQEGEDGAKKALGGRAPFLTKSRSVALALLRNMSAREIPLVFVRAPDLPSRTAAFAGRSERFDRELSELANAYGAHVWDYNPELDLIDADFQDGVHLGSEIGRRRFEDLLVRDLGEILRDRYQLDDVQSNGADGGTPAQPPDKQASP